MKNLFVKLKLMNRVGVIKNGNFINATLMMGNSISVQAEVTDIEYEYTWCWPWNQGPVAKIRETPFLKETACMNIDTQTGLIGGMMKAAKKLKKRY